MALSVVLGHGTQNDFVLIPDPDDVLGHHLAPEAVAALCDRRAGLGADGVIRVVPTKHVADFAQYAAEAPWFMDYRNADGSMAEMCGNGARVFARYLLEHGLVSGPRFAIATRAGVHDVAVVGDEIAIGMGRAAFPEATRLVEVLVDGRVLRGTGVQMPNPHVVTFVDDLDEAGPLLAAPDVLPVGAFPHGSNVEFVLDEGPAHVAMRVHERGSGETRSCGTGACAVAVAARRRQAEVSGRSLDDVDREWIVDVPGGRLRVTEREDGEVVLTGPAVLIATADVDLDCLFRQR